jgi:hypothetical protein
LGQSELRSEDYIKHQLEGYKKTNLVLKYRIYGIDALSRNDFYKLVDMGVIKKKDETKDFITFYNEKVHKARAKRAESVSSS